MGFHFPPFNMTRDREYFPNDSSTEVTYVLTAFYRRFTYSYSRPMRQRDFDRAG